MMKSTLPKDKPGKMRIRAFPVSIALSIILINVSSLSALGLEYSNYFYVTHNH